MTFPRLFYSSIVLYEAPRMLIDLSHTNTILIDWHHYTAITNVHTCRTSQQKEKKNMFLYLPFVCLSVLCFCVSAIAIICDTVHIKLYQQLKWISNM